MRSRKIVSVILGGCCAATALTFALGAEKLEKPAASAAPRYTVHSLGSVFHITDNESDTLYVYVDSPKALVLRSTIDLSQTGKSELVNVKPD